MREKKYVKFFILFILLFAVGCNGVVFKTLVDNSSDSTPPSVVSVYSTAIDSVRVEFSEDIDTTEGSNVSNYTINGLNIFSAAVTANPKVVRLTTDSQFYQLYDITISTNITDLKGNRMASIFNGTFQGAVEEPRIANITTTSVTGVLVEFSEEVNITANDPASYQLSPSISISDVDFPYGGDSTFALLTLGKEMQNTSYTLEIVGDIQDTGGFSIHPLYSEFSFMGDARPKVAMINSGSITTIRLKFTEDVNQATAEDETNYSITQVGGGSLTIPFGGVTRDTTDYSIVIITHNENQVQDASYKVVISNVQDLNGNAVVAGTSGYFLGNGPPMVAKASADGPYKVVVTFSEPIYDVDDSETINANNYTIAGVSITGADWPSGGAGDRTVVELITSKQLQQIYTVVLATNTLRAADDQTYIATGYNAVSFQGDGIPQVSSAMSLDPNQVKVVFSEPVNLTTAQNISNYSITSVGYPSLSITNADRRPDPYTNEVILTTSTQLYVNYTVTVTGVNDTTGNTIAGNNTADFAGEGTDNTPPDLLSVSASGTNVRVYFNEAVEKTSAETESNYTLSDLSTATLTVNGSPLENEQLTIQVTSSVTGLDSVTITAKTTENLSLNEFKLDGSTNEVIAYSIVSAINTDPQSPVRAYTHGQQVELVSRTFGSDGDITITGSLTNVTITGPTASTEMNPDSATRSAGNFAQVDLTFTGLTSGIYELEVLNVRDTTLPPNAIVSATVTVVIRGTDSEPPLLKGAYAPDSTHIKLLFDEPVDFMTSIKASNFAIEREIASFEIVTGTGNNDILTFDYDSGSTYQLKGAGSEDIYSTPNTWNTAGNTDSEATSMSNVMNMSSTSPFTAHAIASTVYIAHREKITSGNIGNIDNISTLDFTIQNVTIIDADYNNNLDIITSARNETFPREVLITLDTLTPLDNSTTHLYGITATGIADITAEMNACNGGTRVVLPISDELTAPSGDLDPPEIVSAQALSDSLVRVIFNEPVDETSAETISNYSISPTLNITSVVRDDTNHNIVLVYTELQGALTYTLTVNAVQDQSSNSASGETATFTGMAAVTVDNGPVGNTINGIGNLNNKSITAMIPFNNRLYIATFNKGSGEFITEVYASDLTGVYFTQANYSGFNPPTTHHKQRQTTSFAIYDDGSGTKLWASTSDTPSEKSNVLYTSGGTTFPHTWTQDTATTDWGNTDTKLLNYGISTPHLYVIEKSNLRYRSGDDSYTLVSASWDTGTPTRMIAFGGRMYVGCSEASGMKVYRSKGANADFPQGSVDFEQVLDADAAGSIGMDGYDDDDPLADPTENHYPDSNNSSVTSIAVFKGYIYIGTENTYGAQIWRSQDGLTWERVLDFGEGAEFGGINDLNNVRITSLQTNGNYLYAGTRNITSGAEVWRTPDGVIWEQFGGNGFGSASYTDVSSMTSFLGLIYIGMEDTTSGGAIFRASN